MIGLKGIKVEHSDQIADAWREAFSADRPVIIDAMTDPEEPPFPPHFSFEQVKSMATSFLEDPKSGLPGAVSAAPGFAKEFIPRQ